MNLSARLDPLHSGHSDDPVIQPASSINSHAVIEQVFNQLDFNIGAWCNDVFLAALADLYQTDRQQLARVYARLKKWGIVTEVKKEVRVFSRKRRISKHPALPTHSTFSNHTVLKNLHCPSTHPTLAAGILVTVNEETGQPALLIESEGALVLAGAVRGFAAYVQSAKTWHIFDGKDSVEATDVFSKAGYSILDPQLAKTAQTGMMLAGYLIEFEDFVIQTGGSVSITREILQADEVVKVIDQIEDDQLATFLNNPSQAAKLARAIVSATIRLGHDRHVSRTAV